MENTNVTLVAAVLVVGILVGIGVGYFMAPVTEKEVHVYLTFEEELALDTFYYSENVDIEDSESFKHYHDGEYYIIFYEPANVIGRGSCIRWRYAQLD